MSAALRAIPATSGCSCRPGERCEPCAFRAAARLRFFTHPHRRAPGMDRENHRRSDPVVLANWYGTLADLRIALRLAGGQDPATIDARTGYSYHQDRMDLVGAAARICGIDLLADN